MKTRNVLNRIIPSSNESIPVLGMGTWKTFDIGNQTDKREKLSKVVRLFTENNSRLIDSSPMYGSSESVTGDTVSELNIRDSVFLATKVWTTGEEQGVEQMNRSFARMRTEVIDLMQVHNLVDVHTHLRTLRKWKEEGRVRYIGITHYTVSAHPELIELMKREKPDFVQCNYNILTRDAELKLLPFASDHGIAVIINRPFEEGKLFQHVNGKSLPAWAGEYEITNWSEYFLKYIVSHPSVTCVIPATSDTQHLLSNIDAVNGILPDQDGRKKMVDYLF